MADQITKVINLSFTADAKAARAEITKLQELLQTAVNTASNNPLGITDEINESIKCASRLSTVLDKAVNPKTGNLNLGNFNQELSKAGLNVDTCAERLASLGPMGEKAFVALAQSVVTAEVPIKRTNALLTDFAQTLKNTAKWQISSSIIHGFMGSLSSAFGYAQDLNKSLTDIRIVTGESAEKMAEFAKQANASAQALSTTTLAYTDASLIFFQQGLDDSAVKERTDAVIKMSNVTGEAVEDVSSYMTAIWNNFDGTYDQLEKYADVITALGAATASSSEEIAGGLEQFASIAQTVGLSYEYATSALATVVSATRQSEDVVGTAFKTIFSRLQGLSLGETLEDGVDLNKYSSALNKVGVEILDAGGNLKDLDDILDDLAGKWGTLERREKTALAQTVAGTRQYNQLISLMDNWDSMENNLSIAKNAEGSLQEQADIYADSWEAAQKRVKTALQEIYAQLVNDDFFIALNNGLASAIKLLSKFIDTMGGVPGLLTAASAAATRLFSKEITNGVSNLMFNLANSTKAGKEALVAQREKWNNAMTGMVTKDPDDAVGSARSDAYESQFKIQGAIIDKNKALAAQHRELNEYEQAELKAILEINNQLGEEYVNTVKIAKEQKKQATNATIRTESAITAAAGKNKSNPDIKARYKRFAKSNLKTANNLGSQASFAGSMGERFQEITENLNGNNFEQQKASLIAYLDTVDESTIKLTKFKDELDAIRNAPSVETLNEAFENFRIKTAEVEVDFDKVLEKIRALGKAAGLSEDQINAQVEELRTSILGTGEAAESAVSDFTNLKRGADQAKKSIEEMGTQGASLQEKFTAGAQVITSFAMVLTSLKGIMDTLSDPDLTWFEKFSSVLMTAGFLIPSVISGLSSLNIMLGATATAETVAGAAADGMWKAMLGPVGWVAGFATLVAVIAGVSGAFANVEKKAKEAQETLDELNESMKSLSSSGDTTQGNISKLEEMSEEYEKLSAKAGEYDRNVDNLTENERSRYNEIKNTLVDLNEEFLGYYNSQGEAVLTTNDALREEIELLKQEYELRKKEIYSGDHAYEVEQAFENEKAGAESTLTKKENAFKEAQGKGRQTAANQIGTVEARLREELAGIGGTSDAFQELDQIIAGGTENIVASKEAIEKSRQILINGVMAATKEPDGITDEDAREKINYINGYFENIIKLADNAETKVKRSAAEVEKAQQELTNANKINVGWAVGVLSSDDSKNEGYTALTEAGVEDAESYLTAYVNGVRDGAESYDEVYEGANAFAQAIAKLFTDDSTLEETLNQAGEDAAKATYDSYQDYVEGTFKVINDLIKSSPALKDLIETDQESASTLFSKIFGLDGVNFDEDGNLSSIVTAYSSKINDFKTDLESVIDEEDSVDRGALTNLIPENQINNLDTILSMLKEAGVDSANWEEKLKEVLAELDQIEAKNFAGSASDSLGNLLEKNAAGSLDSETISSDEDYAAVQQNLEKIKELYPELTTAANIFNNTNLVGTQEWTEAVAKLRDKMDEVQKISLKEDLDEALDKIKDESGEIDIEAFLNSETFEDDLNNILDKDYAIAVEIHSEAEQEFEEMEASFDNLKEQASKIGEDYIIAADDVRELGNAFPGILDKCEDLHNGTLQLSKETVDAAINAAQAEATADAEVTTTKLKDAATELRTKQATYQAIADAAGELAIAEETNASDTAEKKTSLQDALNQINADSTDSQNENSKLVADDSNTNASILASNWSEAYQSAGSNAAKFAEMAVEAAQAAANGYGSVTMQDFGVNYTGSTGKSSEANRLDSMQGLLEDSKGDGKNARKIQEVAQAAANAFGKQANDIESMLYATGADIGSLTTGLGNVRDGAGYSGGSGSGSGGSGGSGGGSEKDPEVKDHEEHTEEEAELYHDVKEAIEEVEHEASKLDKTQEHLYGEELISSLEEENDLLEKQSANYAELNRQIEERQNYLQQQLAIYGNANDYYTTYNNIQKAYNDAVDNYNTLIDTYNAMSAEVQEANEATVEAAKKDLDTRKEAMDKALEYLEEYYSNKSELRSNDEKQQELLYSQIANNLEAYETEIKLELDTTDAERTLAKFLKSIKTDLKNLYKTTAEWAEEFTENSINATTHATDTRTHLDQLDYYRDIYDNEEWGGEGDLFASESETIQAIIDVQKQVIEDGETLLEDYQDAYDDLKDALEEAVDQFDDIIEDFDRIDDTLDHYQKINELLYGDSAAGLQNNETYYAAAAQDSLARQRALNQYVEALRQRRMEALAAGYDEDDDYIKNIDDEINDKTSDLESSIEDYITTIQSQLENSINMAKNAMDQMMWGGDVSDIQQEWDDKKAMAEGYYDEVEKIYKLESLENKWQSAIDSTSTLKAQQQLKALMDKQVEALAEKTDLSEKDVELAEKEIEIYKAQIALEEAQKAKNTMKLVRDESGNWAYQYVANEDDVADKQQAYIDKVNEWRSAAIEATESIKENILSSYTDFSSRMTEIMNDVTLSEAERAAKVNQLNETYYGDNGIISRYVEDSNYIQQQANKATYQEIWGLYDVNEESYEQMTEDQKAIVDSFKEHGITDYTALRDFIIGATGTDGVYGQILSTAENVNKKSSEAWDSMAANAITKMYGEDGHLDKESVTGIVQTAYETMTEALGRYDDAIIESEEASGIAWSNVQGQLTETRDKIDDVTAGIDNVIDTIDDLAEFEQAVLGIQAAWEEVASSIREATEDLKDYLELLEEGDFDEEDEDDWDDDEEEEEASYPTPTVMPAAATPTVPSASSSNANGGDIAVGTVATYSGKYYNDSRGGGGSGSKYSGVADGVIIDKINSSYGDYSYHLKSADGSYSSLGWVKKSQLSGYDTGGYTGDWDGGDGRLALLHSKELVLNKEDTSNILNAVSAIRSIVGIGDVTSAISDSVASLVRGMLNFSSNSKLQNLNTSNEDQDKTNNVFNINAEFPNANSAEEIREAIMSLPTLASQYLSRRSL